MSRYLQDTDTGLDYELVDYDVSFEMLIHDIRTLVRVKSDADSLSVDVDGQPIVTKFGNFKTAVHVCPKRKWSDLWRRR